MKTLQNIQYFCGCFLLCFVFICKEAALQTVQLSIDLLKKDQFVTVGHVLCLHSALCTWNAARSEIGHLINFFLEGRFSYL